MTQTAVDYLAKAKKLSEEERERVLSRMSGKLPKHLKNKKLTEEKAIAFQLELEDEQLEEWREKMAKIREKELKAKSKSEEKAAKPNTKKSAPSATKEVSTVKQASKSGSKSTAKKVATKVTKATT